MTRFKLTIEYFGAPFVGWQRQDNGPSVQGTLEKAVTALTGETPTIQSAGRTDAGVHALGMVAHVDINKQRSADQVRDGLNFHLRPAPIAVLAARVVDDNFHARFSCIKRFYEYRIINRRAPLTFERRRAWRQSIALDAGAMHAAAQHFVGRHDFTTFRAAACQAASPIKTIDEISVDRSNDLIRVRCSARSFLHHQIRSFVGTLAEVGNGAWREQDVAAALDAKDRTRCGPVAPPDGLYFVGADYENNP